MNPTKTVIIIAGPTAVGKTAFAVHLAKALKTEIISADSRQCYSELNIGVAKPSVAELASVKHHFINSHSIQDPVNAAVFEEFALEATEEIFKINDVAVMVGGTGLYIKAFCEGLDGIPEVRDDIRKSISDQYNNNGMSWLQDSIKKEDPAFWEIAEQQNPRRLMRALEILYSTGKSILEFQTGSKQPRTFRILKYGLELPREQLYQRINNRVDSMISQGLVKEAEALINYRHLNALQTVGYKELFETLDGRLPLAKAIDAIKTNSRHYAKRQLTWFKKDQDIHWISPLHSTDLVISEYRKQYDIL